MRRDHDGRAWLAWHTARLTAYAPQKAKDFPKLKDMLHGAKPAGRKMTPEQLEAATRAWLASARGRRKE